MPPKTAPPSLCALTPPLILRPLFPTAENWGSIGKGAFPVQQAARGNPALRASPPDTPFPHSEAAGTSDVKPRVRSFPERLSQGQRFPARPREAWGHRSSGWKGSPAVTAAKTLLFPRLRGRHPDPPPWDLHNFANLNRPLRFPKRLTASGPSLEPNVHSNRLRG